MNALIARIADGGDAAALRSDIEQIGLAYRIQTPFTHYAGSSVGLELLTAQGARSGPPLQNAVTVTL